MELFKLSYSTLQTFLISRLKKVVVIFSKKLLVKLIEKPLGIHAAVSCCSQFLNTVEVRLHKGESMMILEPLVRISRLGYHPG